jgi:glycosyltransferase involved in cell wall biosynthesis
MEKNKVSIIVAIYNSEPFLKKLLDSIINQTYKNLEIILVDDGSPDNSGKICDEYSKKDKRIKVYHKNNGGACDARNFGLEKVTGDFLTIIDGDDWLSLDYVEYLMNIITITNSEMAMTDNIFTTRDQIQIKKDEIKKITNEDAACMIIYPIIPIGPWNKLYKTSLIRKNNISFDIPWSGEGLYFSVVAAQYANSVGLGHRKIYNYRLNNAGSGLTNYKLIMGTNALYNIKYIGNNLIIKTDKLKNAVNWHIWKNYNFVLKLIIATNSKKENKELYYNCLKNIKKSMFNVAYKSEFSLFGKFKIIIKSLFPILFAKKSIKNERKALAKDRME